MRLASTIVAVAALATAGAGADDGEDLRKAAAAGDVVRMRGTATRP
jgi:hypothetical protein